MRDQDGFAYAVVGRASTVDHMGDMLEQVGLSDASEVQPEPEGREYTSSEMKLRAAFAPAAGRAADSATQQNQATKPRLARWLAPPALVTRVLIAKILLFDEVLLRLFKEPGAAWRMGEDTGLLVKTVFVDMGDSFLLCVLVFCTHCCLRAAILDPSGDLDQSAHASFSHRGLRDARLRATPGAGDPSLAGAVQRVRLESRALKAFSAPARAAGRVRSQSMFARHFGMPGKGNLKDLGRSDVSQVLVSEFRQFTVACVATSVVLVLLYLSQQVPADIKAWTTDDRPGVHITAFYILMMVLDQVCAVLLAFYGCAWLLSLKLAAILCSDYVICITSELGTPRVLAHAERENSVWNMRVKRHLQRLVENDFEILLDWASSLGAFGVYISYRCMHTFMSAGMHGRLWHKTYRFTVASSLWANILAMAYVAYIPARFTTECKRMHYALNHLLVRYMIVPNSANVHQILYPCWHAIDQLNMGQGPGFAVVTFTSSIHTNRHMGTVITTHMIFTAVCKFMGAFFLLYAFGARNWNQQLTSNLPETCTLAFEHSIGMFCCGNNMSTA